MLKASENVADPNAETAGTIEVEYLTMKILTTKGVLKTAGKIQNRNRQNPQNRNRQNPQNRNNKIPGTQSSPV